MSSPWIPSSQSVGCIALQILRHVEVHVLPLVKQQESVMVSINRLSQSLNYRVGNYDLRSCQYG